MCHCEDLNVCNKTKSTLKRVDFLYDNEQDSDVVFLVGIEPDVWRIPGHKKILSETNVVFRALLDGPLATRDNIIVIEDVEGRAFDYLLRYLYGKEVNIQSASTALNILYAAHKYLCSGLIQVCVKYLDENMNEKNVLEIYTHARLYAVRDDKTAFEPSAPEASTEIFNEQNGNSIPYWSEALVHNCLQYIDENADQVLVQEGIEDLSSENLKEIIKRDTLKIKSEYVVFLALDRWANRECKRRKLNLNLKNRRFVLNDLIYEIRFPFFTSDEFLLGPIQNGWLDQQELTIFSSLISNKCKNNNNNTGRIPENWKNHMKKICRKRIYNENDSVTLSQRSCGIETEKVKEKNVKKRKIMKASTFDDNEKSCTKCFPEFMVDILVCLFD
ncbi:bpb/poz domain containing protein, putative [Pediculus humanus corporis]|uniref:Bpb/poz domain containing protein, putative n=1 Tax=Pediculus humanus subsp. corporis TaxID=121224 RepID=E0VYV0_PEDHC|nr:bpb/poz domain containing protein, putative [Pediculus humanus corporis]EEB18556.1 bpb/poz domain containing protein, putative [Pediculus humanus corporis]